MRFKLLLFTLLCSLAALLPAKAETLTVYDGTATNDYVPIYGLYVDEFLKCEFIIPASELAEMKDGTITGLTWYLSRTAAASWGNANFQVFVKEVDFSSFSSNAFSGTNGATTVYQGSLDGTQSTMTINFTTPYSYGGGNLLVGVYNTAKGTYKSSAFYGETVSNASINGNNGSSLNNLTQGTRRNFAPKTEFTYEPASAYAKPTNLAVSDITTNSAKASWTGNDDVQSYNLRYRKAAYSEISFLDDFENGLGNWTIYTDGTAPQADGWTITTNGSLDLDAHSGSSVASSWSWSSSAYDANNWLITPQVTFGNNLKFWVSTAGNWPDSYEVLLSTTGNAESDFTVTLQAMAAAPTNNQWNEVIIDLSAYKGQIGYIAIHHVSTDCNYLIIDDFGIYGDDIDASEWITISPATIPQDITGLDPETEYEVQVQAVYADGSSDWTNSVNFTTLPANTMPTDLAVSDVTAYTAKATWNGSQDSYNLRYRKITFFESFETFPGNWTIIDSDGDGYTWSQTDLTTQFSSSYTAVEGNNVVMSRSWINSTVGAVNPDQWLISPQVELGGMLKYFVMDELNYPETYRIYVSTTGTDISDFEPLTDDLLTPNTNKWTECTFDLSAYNGQQGYIAFRHYNCYDQSFMFIDAVSIGDNWTTASNVTSPKTITGLAAESDYEVEVQGIYDNNTTDWTLPVYFTTLEAQAEEATLAEICQNGVITEGQNEYVIADKLIAVYADDVKGILWCKDQGNASVFSTFINDGQVDFLKNDPEAQNGRDWDQSNWIALHFSTPTATNNIGQLVNGAVNRYIKPGTVKGKLIDDVNYALRMDLDQLELVTQADDPDINPDYIPNVYCPANFMPTNLNIWGNEEDGGYTEGSDQNYFFMNPKIQEICEVTYAQWDAINGYFTVPTASGFDGAFYIGTGYNVIQSQNFTSSLQDEHIYRFKAIVQRSDKDNYGPKNVTTPATGITLYPVDLDPTSSEIPTAINTIKANGEVVGVEYVNSLGVVSKTPFQGVNIIVTRYSDGSTTTVKKVFR